MPTYVTLANYTEDIFEELHEMESEEFLEETRETIRAHGGELVDYYLTMGQYDVVAVTEFPDDEALAEAMLSILGQQEVETETLRAFTEAKTREFVGNLGE